MLWNCHFTKNERYHKSFFNAFDRKCAITTSYHIFLQNNNFCRAPLESCFCVVKFGKIIRMIRNVPCCQSTTALRSFILEVIIFRNANKNYLEQLPVKKPSNSCFCCFCWFIKALKLYLCNIVTNQ